jgi:polyisoprenoid-binding protein YceI
VRRRYEQCQSSDRFVISPSQPPQAISVQPETTTSTWVIDRVHSTAQFKVKRMMISNVTGEFTSINGP